MNFSENHLSVLRKTIGEPRRPWIGQVPIEWYKAKLNTANSERSRQILAELTLVGSCRLTRQRLREICRNDGKNVLVGYLCTMAWGAQGGGIRIRHASDAWARRDAIAKKLLKIRSDRLSRNDAYNLFAGTNKVRGLGPAYFTKLLFFFSPSKSNYIMDQWTAKSMILLTGRNFVQMSRGRSAGPTRQNDGKNYTQFCEAIDCLATKLNLTGDKTEELIFSMGGRGGKAGIWRRHVRDHWPEPARANR